jgi:hypothetical protein
MMRSKSLQRCCWTTTADGADAIGGVAGALFFSRGIVQIEAELAQSFRNAQYFVMMRLDWQHRHREGVFTAEPDRNGRVDTT